MKCLTGAYLCAVLVLQLQGPMVDASFWDSFPVVSQVKSAVQLINGDPEGALKTQDNFISQVPLVSQAKSVVELATGNTEAALETQKRFLNNAESMVDGTPLIGHIKGGIHMLTGDEEHGLNIIKDATSNTGTAIGGVLGGPGGAVIGRMSTDMMITNIETAVAAANGNKLEYKPYGMVDYMVNAENKSVDEHMQAILGIVMDAAGGGGRIAKGAKPRYKARLQKHVKSTARKEFKDYLERLQDEGKIDNNQMQEALQLWEDSYYSE